MGEIKMKTAIYAGTFDPVTNGHLDIIKRSCKIFDKVIVAVAGEPKKSLFTVEERVEMLKKATEGISADVDSFNSLLADYVKTKDCNIVIRGLRAVSDFEFELEMALMNKKLNPNFETVFIMTDEKNVFLSSSAVKEVAQLKGDVGQFVPKAVEEKLKEKFK
jgi:pantetheine-phosphate adenylyltransferase